MRMCREIAQEIVDDMTGRSGADGWWDGIDPDIQEEILEEWTDIIRRGVVAP